MPPIIPITSARCDVLPIHVDQSKATFCRLEEKDRKPDVRRRSFYSQKNIINDKLSTGGSVCDRECMVGFAESATDVE